MNYTEWKAKAQFENWALTPTGYQFETDWNKRKYKVNIHTQTNTITITFNNKIIKEFIDRPSNNGFFRDIKISKNIIYSHFILDSNVQWVKRIDSNYTQLKPINKAIKMNTDFIVFDIETYLDADKIHVPYACGWFSNN
jgi:hypothetical protein